MELQSWPARWNPLGASGGAGQRRRVMERANVKGCWEVEKLQTKGLFYLGEQPKAPG